MKKIVAINGSPRAAWNTGTLVCEAARGAEAEGAEVKVFDLYKLENSRAASRALAASCPSMKEFASVGMVLRLCWTRFAARTD